MSTNLDFEQCFIWKPPVVKIFMFFPKPNIKCAQQDNYNVTTILNITYFIQVAAALAIQLDIWTTVSVTREYGQQQYETISGGSTLEISEGRGGQTILNYSTTDNSTTDNKSELACQIVKRPFQPTGDIKAANALATVASRMFERRSQRLTKGINQARAQVIVLVTFS